MEVRKVVTTFLEYNGMVLILRRSSRVGTMKGKWAGISGYLEGSEDPMSRALKEVREETGIPSDKLQFVRTAEPIEAQDLVTPGMVWMVHPYLYRTMENKILLDWEHDQYRWIKPEEIGHYDSVPRLDEVLKSLLPLSTPRTGKV